MSSENRVMYGNSGFIGYEESFVRPFIARSSRDLSKRLGIPKHQNLVINGEINRSLSGYFSK